MRIGKIARIKTNFSGDDYFRVEYGFKKEEIVFGEYTGLKFATIKFCGRFYCPSFKEQYDENVYTQICGGHWVEDLEDGFKKVVICNSRELLENEEEEYLLVIIPCVNKYEAPEKRIAGRYPEEAILVLKPGDELILYGNNNNNNKEKFMAVKAGNELFLLKKRR